MIKMLLNVIEHTKHTFDAFKDNKHAYHASKCVYMI